MPDYVSSECLDKLINGDPFQKATWGMLCCVWQVSYTCSIKPLLLWHLNPHTHKSLIFPNYPIKGLTRLCTWSLRGKFLSLESSKFFFQVLLSSPCHITNTSSLSPLWIREGGCPSAILKGLALRCCPVNPYLDTQWQGLLVILEEDLPFDRVLLKSIKTNF